MSSYYHIHLQKAVYKKDKKLHICKPTNMALSMNMITGSGYFNNFPANGGFNCPLIKFTNSLVPDLARQNIVPDLDLNCLTLIIFLKDCYIFFCVVGLHSPSVNN